MKWWWAFAACAVAKTLWLTVVGISWFWFVGGLFLIALLLFGPESLHVSAVRAGFLVTALSIGIGTGSVMAGKFSGDHIEAWSGAGGLGSTGRIHHCTRTHSFLRMGGGLADHGGILRRPVRGAAQRVAAGARGQGRKGPHPGDQQLFNMVGVVLASGVLWTLHDKLHWNAAHVIVALGIATLVATLYVASVLTDVTLRVLVLGILRAFFRVRILNGERIPTEGGACWWPIMCPTWMCRCWAIPRTASSVS